MVMVQRRSKVLRKNANSSSRNHHGTTTVVVVVVVVGISYDTPTWMVSHVFCVHSKEQLDFKV